MFIDRRPESPLEHTASGNEYGLPPVSRLNAAIVSADDNDALSARISLTDSMHLVKPLDDQGL